MRRTTTLHVANIWSNVSAIFMVVGFAVAIAATIWEPRGLPICFMPLTVAFVAKQGEARVLRSALEPKAGSTT
jgi:hypothetical protein